MSRPLISTTIIAFNEEAHIRNAIESASWTDEVLVVDSGSTDRTVQIAKECGARVVYNPWSGYGQQKNFAQKQASHDWILNIDADEVVPEALKEEILQALQAIEQSSEHPKEESVKGFSFPRKTFYLGKWIRYGGWYPNRLVRFADRRFSEWSEPFIHEGLTVKGRTRELLQPLHHFAFSSIKDQVLTNINFSHLGFKQLKASGKRPSLLKLLLKPPGKFIETYIIKAGFLDGLSGFIISVNAAYSIFLKYAYLVEPRIRYENSNY